MPGGGGGGAAGAAGRERGLAWEKAWGDLQGEAGSCREKQGAAGRSGVLQRAQGAAAAEAEAGESL